MPMPMPMPMPMTIEDIDALAAVSRSTVSRVLNNHPSVRPAVRDRVLRVIREHNYAPRPPPAAWPARAPTPSAC
jgi:DNA-binding LacI/PurR family transcriptional regulator